MVSYRCKVELSKPTKVNFKEVVNMIGKDVMNFILENGLEDGFVYFEPKNGDAVLICSIDQTSENIYLTSY